MDLDHTLCSNPRCVAVTPLAELLGMALFQIEDMKSDALGIP